MKNTNNHNEKTPKHLKEAIFKRIEGEKVCPKSKLLFRSKECMVWLLWVLSVAVGALALAVSLFVVTHHQYALYEATHDNFFTFLVEALPYLWIVLFGVMVYVAIYNLRHTSHGYRYPVWVILSSSMILSFAGGSALQFFGFGYAIDNILGDNMEMYMSQEKFEKKMWQNPDKGLLLGRQVMVTVSPTSTIIFEDLSGQRWRMNISELLPEEISLLKEEKTVRLLGKTTNNKVFIFHACAAFSWVFNENIRMEDLDKERKLFIERVSNHAQKTRKLSFAEGATFASARLNEESVCATIPPVRKHIVESQVF